jgi:hypothetical protein
MSEIVPTSLTLNTEALSFDDYQALLRVLGGMGVEAVAEHDPTRSSELLAADALPKLRAFPEYTGDAPDYLLTQADFVICAEAYGFNNATNGVATKAFNALLRLTKITRVELCTSRRAPLEWGISAREAIALAAEPCDKQDMTGLAVFGKPDGQLSRLVAITLANKQAQIEHHEQPAQALQQPNLVTVR